MPLLTSLASTELDDLLTVGLVALLALVVIIAVIRKAAANKKAASVTVTAVEASAQQDAPAAPGSAGKLKIHNIEPKTAAMLMAIVAEKTGKPLNELRFISIKEVE